MNAHDWFGDNGLGDLDKIDLGFKTGSGRVDISLGILIGIVVGVGISVLVYLF